MGVGLPTFQSKYYRGVLSRELTRNYLVSSSLIAKGKRVENT